MATIVNLEEMAGILAVSLPTMRALMKRYPDLPILQEGTNGRAYQLDAETVTAFIAAKRQEEEAEAARRGALLDQFRLPIDAPADGTTALSPQQELAGVRAMALRQEMAKEAGFLVPAADVRRHMATHLAALARFLQDLPDMLGRRHGLPEPILRDMRRSIGEQQTIFATAMMQGGPAASPPDAPATG